MNNHLQVQIKQVYGNPLIYPACDQSKRLCDLIARKTFTKDHIELLKTIGFVIETVAPPLEEITHVNQD